MFSTKVLILLFLLFFTQIYCAKIEKVNGNEHFNLHDLIDDAKALYEELRAKILGFSLVVRDEIDDLRLDITTYRVNVRLQLEIELEEEDILIQEELTNFKDLALTENVNISSCLVDTEDQLNELSTIYLQQIKGCIYDVSVESDQLLADTQYKVDVLVNYVYYYNYTLSKCEPDDTECISKVIDEMTDANKNLPLQMEADVNEAKEKLKIIKVEIQDCADNGIAKFVEEAGDILQKITDCINNILNLG